VSRCRRACHGARDLDGLGLGVDRPMGMRRLGQVHRDHHTGGDVLLGDDTDIFPGSVRND
jgi:hypothetical protein